MQNKKKLSEKRSHNMGMRFRKSFKIAPGVKFNVNKKSVGMTYL